MINTNIPTSSSISAVRAKVDIYNNATLVTTCTCDEHLQDFVLTREGDTSKFFGFGVSHKAAISLLDIDHTLPSILKGYTVKLALGDGTNFDYPFPTLHIAEITKEEKSNTITCAAYDILYKTNSHTISELNLVAPYTLRDVAIKCAEFLGLEVIGLDEAFNISYPEGANVEGTEPIRTMLNAIAEVTQTIYFINGENKLVFKRLDRDGEALFTVTKDLYYELSTQTNKTLSNICHTTELGDNIYSGDNSGITQYVRDNPLWEGRADAGALLDAAVERVAGLTITQLECDWDGNHLLEIGDKVAFETEDDSLVNCFILDDVIDFQGFINEITSWEFTQDESSTAANPTTIGEKISQTFAKVDKINKEITLMASDVSDTKTEMAQLKLTTDDIILRVEKVEKQEIEIDLDLTNDTNFIALSERVGQLEISDTQINASISSLETTLSQDIDKSIEDLESALKGEIQAGDNALNSEIVSVKERVGALEISDTEIKASVSNVQTTITTVESNLTTKIDTDINNLESSLQESIEAGDNALGGEITTVKQDVSALQIKANEIEASVSSLESSTSTNLSNAISGIEGNLEELEEALRAEYENADELLNESINGEFTAVRQDISSLRVETNSITASVSSLQKVTENTTDALENEIASLAKEVNLKVDSEAVSISIAKALDAGVDKVKTSSKNYTFDDEGLNISSSDSDFNTVVNEDGMRIYKGSTEVLTANNEGVTATDLHARTFLIIGENSRLEDRGSRTACFWIGKAGG